MSCNANRTKLDWHWGIGYVDVETYLDHNSVEAITDWSGASEFGAMLIYEVLEKRGVISTSVPSWVGLAIGAVIYSYIGWMASEDTGCGVVVETHVAIAGGPQFATVRSQNG